MKNRLWHFGSVGVVFGLLAATGVASTPTFTLTLAGIRKPGEDAVIFRNLPSTQFGVECDPNNDECPEIAGPGSECVATEVIISGLYQNRCSPIRGVVPLLCEGGPTPGEPCDADIDCGLDGTCTSSFVEPRDQIAIDVFLRGWDDEPDMGICSDRVTICGMDGSPPCRGRHCNVGGQPCSDLNPCPDGQVCIPDTCRDGPILGSYSWTADWGSFVSTTTGDVIGRMEPAPIPCVFDEDCRWDRTNTAQCTCGGATCQSNRECTLDGTAYIDKVRADFLYKDAASPIVNVSLGPLTFFGVGNINRVDDQKEEYVGTLWLLVADLAAGTYDLDLIRNLKFTTVTDDVFMDFPTPNVETLQIKIHNPCSDFDVNIECEEPPICGTVRCVPQFGLPICIVFPRNCEEEPEFGPGYDCVTEEGGCVPFRACCTEINQVVRCSRKSELWCDGNNGDWLPSSFDCDPPNPCFNCDGAMDWASSDPPSGVLDARQARDVADGSILQGIDTIVVEGDPTLAPMCFTLCETEAEGSDNDLSVAEDPAGTYTITLDRRITPGAVTRITFDEGGRAESVGTYSSLPGDTNADELSDIDDIIELVECCLNQNCLPVHDDYSCDIDHSGSNTGADVLRVLDVLNGSGDFVQAWEGVQLNTTGCP